MATLNISSNNKVVKGRAKRELPKVDLTAMVDLAFLLITFFMLTTSLSKMNGMDVVKPVPINETADLEPYPASRTMTILMGKDNKFVTFMGNATAANMQITSITKLKSQINYNQLKVAELHTNPVKQLLVIIKPTSSSKYKNFVDVIDEMKIANIATYAIDDKYVTDMEKLFMLKNGL